MTKTVRQPYILSLRHFTFSNVPCMKSTHRDKKTSVLWSAARKKNDSRSAIKPQKNRLSTADFVPAFGLHNVSLVRAFAERSVSIGFRLFVLREKLFRRSVFDALERTRGACFLNEQCCRYRFLRGPVRPPRRAPRPDPPVACPSLELDR